MRMMLEDDGHTGIFHANSLETMDKISQNALLAGAKDIGEKSAEIILTNPPFGKKGTITEKEVLNQYTLAKQNKYEKDSSTKENSSLDEQVPDVLFIERCYHFLRNYGRIAIVLPDGILSGPKMQFVRDFVFSHFKVVAIISLPYETFIPHGANVKASLLIMQKLSDENIKKLIKKGYNTFLADVERIGYQGNKNGTLIYKTDEKGAFIYDDKKEKILDEDISEVIEKWNQYLIDNVEVWEK
jgi:type I restriction enzyme M protein